MKAAELRNQVKEMADELTTKVYAPVGVASGYKPSLNRLMQAQMLLVAHSVATGDNKAEVLKALNSFAEDANAQEPTPPPSRLLKEHSDAPTPTRYEITDENGVVLASCSSIIIANNGLNAYPDYKVNALKVGQSLRSNLDHNRYLKRVV